MAEDGECDYLTAGGHGAQGFNIEKVVGIPIFAGPGSITTVMIYMSEATRDGLEWGLAGTIYLAIIVTMVISYILLYYGERVFQRIGRMGALAFSRIMGLILAAMAIQFILTGIVNFLIEHGALAV